MELGKSFNMSPLHARIELLSFVPCNYFSPPSLPERPVVKVIAFFAGMEYYFNRNSHGEDWQLIEIKEKL
jgi:hypothetical protein